MDNSINFTSNSSVSIFPGGYREYLSFRAIICNIDTSSDTEGLLLAISGLMSMKMFGVSHQPSFDGFCISFRLHVSNLERYGLISSQNAQRILDFGKNLLNVPQQFATILPVVPNSTIESDGSKRIIEMEEGRFIVDLFINSDSAHVLDLAYDGTRRLTDFPLAIRRHLEDNLDISPNFTWHYYSRGGEFSTLLPNGDLQVTDDSLMLSVWRKTMESRRLKASHR